MDIFSFTLIAHVVAGIVALSASFILTIFLFKRELKWPAAFYSSLASLSFYIISWISGAYYYVLKYGSEVKALILNGKNPFAHSIFMEWKEHVFLFLPFVMAVIALSLFLIKEKSDGEKTLVRSIGYLSILAFIFGVLISLAGVFISGSAKV